MNAKTLFDAIQRGETDQVHQILTELPELLRTRSDRQATPLLWAIYTGQAAVRDVIAAHHPEPDIWEAAALGDHTRVAGLIEKDPELANATAPDGFQPLGLTAFFGHADLLEWLLQNGADPNAAAANPMRVRPIHSAAAHRQPETARRMVKALLEAGAEVNIAQHGGWTPLHQAAAHGDAVLVDLLLNYGADFHAQSEDGRTPAAMARENGFEMLAQKLT